jgi:hypothetical protein
MAIGPRLGERLRMPAQFPLRERGQDHRPGSSFRFVSPWTRRPFIRSGSARRTRTRRESTSTSRRRRPASSSGRIGP